MTKTTKKGYECKQAWPEDCYVQSGGSGVVLSSKAGDSYRTAFFEAFPKNPRTFIRGEGESIEAAEAKAFEIFTAYQACDHDFTRIDDQGRGECKHCKMDSRNALPNLQACAECDVQGVSHRHPLKKKQHICVSCLAGEVGEEILAQPIIFDLEREKANERSSLLGGSDQPNRVYADDYFSDEFIKRVNLKLLALMMKDRLFTDLSEDDKVTKLENLRHFPFKVISHVMHRIMKNLQYLFPSSRELAYLDDGAYYEIAVNSDATLENLVRYCYLSWRDNQIEGALEDPEKKAALKIAYRSFVGSHMEAILMTLEQWKTDPPEDAEERKRISTPEEFENGLKSMVDALANAASMKA